MRKPTAPIALAALIVTAFLIVKARLEERLLAVRYPEYGAYRSRTFGVVSPTL